MVGVELGSGIALQLPFGIAAQCYGVPTRELLGVFTSAMFIFSIFVIIIALDVLRRNICARGVIGVSTQIVNCIGFFDGIWRSFWLHNGRLSDQGCFVEENL